MKVKSHFTLDHVLNYRLFGSPISHNVLLPSLGSDIAVRNTLLVEKHFQCTTNLVVEIHPHLIHLPLAIPRITKEGNKIRLDVHHVYRCREERSEQPLELVTARTVGQKRFLAGDIENSNIDTMFFTTRARESNSKFYSSICHG